MKGGNARINRNIVECKLLSIAAERKRRQGINRNIVECKSSTDALINLAAQLELIETLWNVNTSSEDFLRDKTMN